MSEDPHTPVAAQAEPSTQRRVRHPGGRCAYDGKNVIVARKRGDVPRARGRDVLTPRPRLGIDYAEYGRTAGVGRRDIELPVARVVPNLVSTTNLRDVVDNGAIDRIHDEREATGDEQPLKGTLCEAGAAAVG